MKNILCFGDSFVWGFNPKDRSRFSYENRWTGILQNLLGSHHRIIEEGLNLRTTAFDDFFTPYRSMGTGVEMLPMMLDTHYPVDLVILMLGTNDFQEHREMTVEKSAKGMALCIKRILASCASPEGKAPKILLVTPPKFNPTNELMSIVFGNSVPNCTELAKSYSLIASAFGVEFLDITEKIEASKLDGIHLDEKGNEVLASLLYEKIVNIFS